MPHPEEQQLSELFGSYKAEWLRERIFDLFTEPAYFPELVTPRPCLLVGGRGTGKTTVLRSLSYEGRFALSQLDALQIPNWTYYGFYYRVNTNRVTAFQGPELDATTWTRLFGHYVNLVLCGSVIRFLDWYSLHVPKSDVLSAAACQKIGASLALATVSSVPSLIEALEIARLEFEAFVNNIQKDRLPRLSLQGAPVDELLHEVSQLPQFNGKSFFFLIDEYENFLDYQQIVVNTLIKHAGENYSFKVGVRELGWRKRATLNENEQLISPADYIRINIAEQLVGLRFEEFARSVCNARISRLEIASDAGPTDIRDALPGLGEDDEAALLGIGDVIADMRARIVDALSAIPTTLPFQLTDLGIYFVMFWANGHGQSVEEVVAEMAGDAAGWEIRFGNYKHALLYTLRAGKRGIRKYYCGWDVYVQLAASNIRYLLELVDQSLLLHLRQGGTLSQKVPQDVQTKAAHAVGRKNLSELEGLSVRGAQLTKLLLGLGRIFEVMAAEAAGHAPEVNQFYLAEDNHSDPEALRLLDAAVMHLALLRSPGSKLADEADTRAYDYWVHPIYTPFFAFSYRKKRKTGLTSRHIIGLVRAPRETIREVLRKNRRAGDEPLPEQLKLFEGYYASNS